MASIVLNYTIAFGSNIRIGYKPVGSTSGYTYVMPYPDYSQSPYTLTVPTPGTYQIELTTVCSSCAGGLYSSPVVINATAT